MRPPAKRHAGRTPISRTPVRIRTSGVALTAAVEERTLQILRRRLARFGTRIRRVDVRVADVNGPRGGRDTVARIQLSVAGDRPSSSRSARWKPAKRFRGPPRRSRSRWIARWGSIG